MITFNDLNINAPLANALHDAGFVHPTVIQQRAFPVAMSGRDVIGIAQTGTGKTLAYLLPCLRQWKFTKEKHPQILVLAPTRELVVQIVEMANTLSAYLNIRISGVFGGINMSKQAEEVMQGVDLLVATPGRLLDLALNGAVRLKSVKKLIVDEVDEMLDLGFRPQLIRIFDLLPSKRQNLLFSATLTEEVERLTHDFFNAPEKIEAAPSGTPLSNIAQSGYAVPNFNTKINLLKWLLADLSMTKTLVFVSTKKLADDVYDRLTEVFPKKIGVIHSNKAQNSRFDAIRRFQSGELPALIATDIVARGIDIAEVSHVINFDMPEQAEDYIHRIGRTGRIDKKGDAITFITPDEEINQLYAEELMKQPVPMLPLPEEVAVSTELTPDEKTKNSTSNIRLKLTNIKQGGGAFHEKKAKNKKVNTKIRHAELMRIKYGKPKTRGQKPKKR